MLRLGVSLSRRISLALQILPTLRKVVSAGQAVVATRPGNLGDWHCWDSGLEDRRKIIERRSRHLGRG